MDKMVTSFFLFLSKFLTDLVSIFLLLFPFWSNVQIITGDKEVVITNDGATIVKTMAVKHPAAKMV